MKFKHALMYSIILSSILYFVGFSNVHAAEEAKSANSMAGMTHEMQKSMDPNTWMQMMTMMMDPNVTPMQNCALCHEGEDLARYKKDFGPMMDSMHGMYKSAAPHQAMQSMNPMAMMNPMMGMMNPMMGMMNPMMNMMGPMMNPMSMMGMMGPMMGMMGPMMNPMGMMGGGMNPMSMMGGGMNPMSMMNPMGMMGGMMNPMGMMGGGMNPMGMMGGGTNANPMGNMMQPDQYADWFKQMTEMMQNSAPAQQQ